MKKKKIKTSDLALIFVAAVLVLFTITMIITFNRMGAVPDTLILAVFACLGTETGMLAWIRNSKLKYENQNYEDFNFNQEGDD